jgi:tetratricopeptide (TPR) repeat protein
MGLAVLCACAGSVALLWWEVPLQGLLAENRLARANDARAHGKLAHAQALYQETIARSRYVPDYVLPHAYLADCLIQTAGAKESASARAAGLGEAARALEELRLLAPDLYLVDTNLGKTYMALAREAMEPSPAAPEDSLRARLYAERAAAMFNAQVTVRPYHMTLPRRRLAEALHTLSHGYLPLCIEQLRGVLALDPLDAPARYLLGQYLSEKGELSEAVCQLEVSSALRKKLMARQVKRWVVALVACDFQAVHRALSLADFQAKAIAQAECSLARVLHAMQADEQACRHLAEALRFWPKCPEAEVLLHTLSPPKEGA